MLFCILQIKLITNDELGEGAQLKAGGGVTQNTTLKQGAPISTATQRAQTTTRHHHIEKLSGDNCKPLYSQMLAKREVRGRGNLPHKSKIYYSII